MNNRTVPVTTPDSCYDIRIAPSFSAEDFRPFVENRKCLIVTDSNLAEKYLGHFYRMMAAAGALKTATFQFEAGESSKTFRVVEEICRTAVLRGLDRTSVILALGGGVTGDMAGFASAIYMRGIPFIQIPTSLLAMVDSSVGGKTGCDLPEGKNLIGAFHQPLAVFTALDFLQTLPDSEYRCGLAEILKTAAILDIHFFEFLEQNIRKILAREPDAVSRMIARSCELKAQIVSRDEKENGVRAILNYGHTFGHAVEKISNFELPHGAAVAVGMCMVCDFAVRTGRMKQEDAERQKTLIRAAGLPDSYFCDRSLIFETLLRDKKVLNGKLRLIVTPETGRAEIMEPDPETVREFLSC